jgi:hypothetical protein
MFQVDVVGLRALDGRFDSMINRELVAIQMEEARAGGDVLLDMYKDQAPEGEGGDGHFKDSFHLTVLEEGFGFSIAIETSQPQKREWLKHGTGIYGPRGERIRPTHSKALAFTWQGQDWVLASIAGMKPNPWELKAEAMVAPFAVMMGNKIGHRVVAGLSQA